MMTVRLIHLNGEVKSVDVGAQGTHVYVFWPIAGWYRVFLKSGRIGGARSWRVHEEDLAQLRPPAKTRRSRKKDEVAATEEAG